MRYSTEPKFRKYDKDNYKPSKEIRFKTSMLRSDLCDFSDAHIVVKGVLLLEK